MRKIIIFGVVGILVLIGLSMIYATRSKKLSPAEQAWQQFLAVNSAWLLPAPPSVSYELLIENKKVHWNKDTKSTKYTWQDEDAWHIQTWYTPADNVRFVHFREGAACDSTNNIVEYRYDGGRGGLMVIPPKNHNFRLKDNLLMAAKIGTQFRTSLHHFAKHRLPSTTVLKNRGEGKTILSVSVPENRQRWLGSEIYKYALHPLNRGLGIFSHCNVVEIEMGSKTLLPIRIVESYPDDNTKVVISFGDEWLEINGKPAPKRIIVKGVNGEMIYHFEVQAGVWLAKEVICKVYSESSWTKSMVTTLKVKDNSREMFRLPTDVELPKRSETSLAIGERIITFHTEDHQVLEGKLSMPVGQQGSVPVVFFLPGAGPWTFDRPVVYPDPNDKGIPPKTMVYNYCDFYAKELTRKGIAFFRINKRGCAAIKKKPYRLVNRAIFSNATPSILLSDYRAALSALRKQSDIDANRIVLLGASEGTILAPQLALEKPEGIVAVAMIGYVEDNARDVLMWQHTRGAWRNMALLFDGDGNGEITPTEFNNGPNLSGTKAFQSTIFRKIDLDGDGVLKPKDMYKANATKLQSILRAVEERDDDYLWHNVLNLSSAYLLEGWSRQPNHKILLKLQVPVAIFHGQMDGTCRVEGVVKTQQVFKKLGRMNLDVRIYPQAGHNLNWVKHLFERRTPKAFEDIFEYIENIVGGK